MEELGGKKPAEDAKNPLKDAKPEPAGKFMLSRMMVGTNPNTGVREELLATNKGLLAKGEDRRRHSALADTYIPSTRLEHGEILLSRQAKNKGMMRERVGSMPLLVMDDSKLDSPLKRMLVVGRGAESTSAAAAAAANALLATTAGADPATATSNALAVNAPALGASAGAGAGALAHATAGQYVRRRRMSELVREVVDQSRAQRDVVEARNFEMGGKSLHFLGEGLLPIQ
jgi:hypothetical protein